MHDRLTVAHIDEGLAREIFGRNVLNSQRIIGGDFETALVDIIVQLEDPPALQDGRLQVNDLAKRIARGLRQGFAGLPPNGLDFCSWLWDVAPLHYVAIPSANEFGMARGFQYGVLHLRKIACMVLGAYTDEQPQVAAQLVPMLDSSVDWVDARNCIIHVFLERYVRDFPVDAAELRTIAAEPAAWRKLLPLVVAARLMSLHADYTAEALALLPPTFEAISNTNVYAAITLALRSAVMYGNHDALASFLNTCAPIEHPELRRAICETFARPRIHWDPVLRRTGAELIRAWHDVSPQQLAGKAEAALAALGVSTAR